ncbi:MAG: c-type cytochrome [Planctomycetia bacterium]|nr:c-type cytochrome [Planctomycetia bacterium]
MRCASGLCWVLMLAAAAIARADGNRLVYLDQNDPFYVSRSFPKLVTPQWVGEEGVQAVVILAIDDMKEHEKWETYLRPILNRLKKIDGRAPVSIMTNRIDPRHPHLQTWLKEGVSLETHTYDHPCPLLKDGDFAKAKAAYDRCVDQMDVIPGSRAVAFRMPCCDSLNTPSPRFYAEIFNRKTPQGNFLSIDSSVCNIITGNDPELPRQLVLNERGEEIFRRYIPFKSFVTTVEDYPYPYVIGRLCWEFPCLVPSDWSAQKLQKPYNPDTVRDFERALDAAVIKQGVFTLIFHPHNWVRNDQIIELIDHAVKQHGKKIKFLTFREAQERLNKSLLAGQSLRATDGSDNGVRILDLNNDGYLDVLIGNERVRQTRLWSPRTQKWIAGELPASLVAADEAGAGHDSGTRFGVLRSDGFASMIVRNEQVAGGWNFDGQRWIADPSLLTGLELDGKPIFTCQQGLDQGVRLRDVDADGRTELIVSNAWRQGAFSFEPQHGWKKLPFVLPAGTTIVDAQGRDAGLRFVDIDQDGYDDILFSNEGGYAAHRFESRDKGWSRTLVAGKRTDGDAVPMISRSGTNNGAWIHGRHLWVQNEDTNKLPDLVDRKPLDDLLKDVMFPGPKSPQISLSVTRARPGFQVDLAAAEPLVLDPIAFAWGPDGKFWVVEMGDYPRGIDGKGKRGGVVRYLEDTDGDGHYDKSTVFLDDLGFPTNVAPWRNGALVTCAPDILYAEDTNGDGKADKREVLYHGFVEGNPQHRVNGLKWGLDGWLYCAHGNAVGEKIKLLKTGGEANANGRDFRIRPDEGLLDPQSGPSQYGRNRDDWDNWFGCANSDPMYQFVLADHYLRRNKHVPAANGRVDVSEQPGAAEVFPRSRTIARYNDLYAANRFTSANSTIVYRDDFFGPAFEGNAFVSEPVHNLVHREVMRPEGLTFTSRRADDEKESEFLASADNWFRPAMLAAGPDGALWVADMYRQTIEHPEWIPMEVQKKIDLRAGSDKGRIYRVYPIGSRPRKIPRLDKLSTNELVAAMDSPSGWQRDMVQQLLLWRDDKWAIEPLRRLVTQSQRANCRVQALWTLELLGGLQPEMIAGCMADPHPGVRRHAVRLSEGHLAKAPELGEKIVELASDGDMQVQLQRAYTLGEWHHPGAGTALGQLALRYRDDRFITAAVLSSVMPENLHEIVTTVLNVEPGNEPPANLLEQLVGLASTFEDDRTLASALLKIGKAESGKYAAWQLTALAGLLDALARRDVSWEKYDPAKELTKMFEFARCIVANDAAPEEERLRAVRLLGRSVNQREVDIASLVALLVPQSSGALQTTAVEALGRLESDQVPTALLAGWKGHGPALRSEILDLLLSRTAWVEMLLGAIKNGQVPATDIDAARRQRLVRFKDDHIKELAAKLLLGPIESNRQQILQQHASVLTMTGDAQAGAAVFAKRCSVCHRLRGAGHEVGPNLAALTDYSPPALLTAILDPNKGVEAKYLDYLAVTTSGLTYTGMLANETGNSVTLMGQEGKQQTILRTELEALQASGKSLMPEGLEKDLSQQDLANVIAFLRGSGAPRKTFEANNPQLVKPTTDGTLQLYATNCEIYGPTLVMQQLYKNLGKWQSENDRAVWSVEVPKSGKYAMLLNYACLDNSAGNSWLLEAGEKTLSGKVAPTGSLDRYQEIRTGDIELAPGTQQVVFRSAGPIKGNLLQLGGILLKPAPAAR